MSLYHSAKGSVGYDIVGTPTIVDGVVSDFSSGELTSEQVFSPGSSTWEIGFDFTTGSFTGAQGVITGVGTSDSIAPLFIQSDGRMSFYASSNGSSWDLANQFNIGNIAANTHYFIKEKYTGSEYTIDVWINGVQQTQKVLSTSTPIIGGLKLLFGNNRNTGAADYFRGSINLNSTYIIIDGQPWFGVCPIELQKHQLMGPVGYTVVGSPTITDGVASGFSDTDNLKLSQTSVKEGNLEMKFEFTTGADITTGQYLFSWRSNPSGENRSCGIYISNGRYGAVIRQIDDTNNQYTGAYLQANTHYYLKTIFNTGDKSLKVGLSTDDISYIYGIEKTLSSNLCLFNATNYLPTIGRGVPSNFYFNGSIDLNGTYIKVNGKLWFWQPRETEKIVVNGVEVWTKPNPLMIPLGLQKVGNPTVQNGIVSGFSTNDYLQFTQRGPDFAPGTTMVVKFKIDDTNANHGIFGNITPNEKAGISLVTGSNNTYLWVYFAMRGYSSWTNSFNFASQLSTDTWYYLRVSHANNDTSSSSQPYGINFDLSTDGQNWTLWRSGNYPYEATIPTANYCLGCIGNPNTSGVYNALRGSIDLNETYIEQEVGGQTLRYIPLVQEPSLPTGYTKVGNPVFVGTKVNCFNMDNYLKTTAEMPKFNGSEWKTKFTTGSTYQISTQTIMVNDNGCNLEQDPNGRITAWSFGGTTQYTLFSAQPYTTYYVKINISNNVRTYSYSTDDVTYTQVAQFTDTAMVDGGHIYLGRHPNNNLNRIFNGTIDLSETYIKIDGQYWLPPAQ